MNLSANGFSQAALTMQSAAAIPAGTPVVLTDNFTVAAGADGNAFCGVALSARGGACAVQLRGAVTLPYSGEMPAVGAGSLVCDGNGGVKTAQDGTPVLILAADDTLGTVTCIL